MAQLQQVAWQCTVTKNIFRPPNLLLYYNTVDLWPISGLKSERFPSFTLSTFLRSAKRANFWQPGLCDFTKGNLIMHLKPLGLLFFLAGLRPRITTRMCNSRTTESSNPVNKNPVNKKHLELAFVCLTGTTRVHMQICEQSYMPWRPHLS